MPLPQDEFVNPTNAHLFRDPEAQATQSAFFAINIIGGQIFIPILIIATFIRRNAYSRSLIFLNFCFSWIIYSGAFVLLFYAGEYQGPNQPNWGLCSLQSVLVYITQVWSVSAFMAMPIHLWLAARSLEPGNAKGDHNMNRQRNTFILFAFPYVVVLIYSIGAIVAATSNPDKVGLVFLFCSIDFSPIRNAVSIYAMIGIPVALFVHADTGRRLYKNRLVLQQVKVNGSSFTSLFIRMGLFGIWALAGVVAAILAVKDNNMKGPRQLVQASFPLAAFIIFGSNPGVWKADPPPAPTGSPPAKSTTLSSYRSNEPNLNNAV